MKFEAPYLAAREEIRAIYADLAERPVLRDCVFRAGCCHFKQTGLVPQLTAGEALLLADGLRASGRKSIPKRADGACPLLHPGTSRCIAYAQRPFGCRTHFCRPAGGPLPRRDVLDLIRRLEAVDAKLNGTGPAPLPKALERAMQSHV